MTPEEIQDLEEQAAKGNPEACVKLSFYLMATDASNPDSVKRAGLLNKKAVEEFKNRLVRCIGRSTFEAADIEAESKLHLGLLYETGPVGIKRDPITAFYLIQDAFRSFRKGDAYFIRCNHFLDNMASFGYGNFCQETDEWKKLAEITDNIQNLEHEAFSLGIKIAQSVEDALINLESMLERFAAEDDSLRSEILYLRAKANYLLAAIKSDEFHSPNSFFYLEKDLSSLFNGYDLKLNIVKSKFDITDKLLDPTALSSIAAFNKCIENLSKASDLGNGKATKELGRFYKRLAGVREKKNGGPIYEQSMAMFFRAANAKDAAAFLSIAWENVEKYLFEGTNPESDFSDHDLNLWTTGMDLEGPSAVHPHCVYFLMAAKWIPLAERLKYWLVAGCGENEIDEYVSPSDIALGEMRIDAWKRTLDFLGKLRSNKPLSVRSRDAEGAESFGIRPKPGESVFELKCPSEPGDDEIEISEKPIEAELEFHSFDIFPPTIKIR